MSAIFRTVGNFVHGVYHAVDHFAAMTRGLEALCAAKPDGRYRRFASGRQLFHAGRRLFQSGCLLFGTGREVGITGGNLPGAGIIASEPSRTLRYGVNQRALHMFATVPASSPISLRPETVSVFARRSPLAISRI